jgi:hypothetical protein
MAEDFQEELTAVPPVDELIGGWSSEWNATEDERSSMVSELLAARTPFLANQTNGFEFFDLTFGETDGGQRRLDWSERRDLIGILPSALPFASGT